MLVEAFGDSDGAHLESGLTMTRAVTAGEISSSGESVNIDTKPLMELLWPERELPFLLRESWATVCCAETNHTFQELPCIFLSSIVQLKTNTSLLLMHGASRTSQNGKAPSVSDFTSEIS